MPVQYAIVGNVLEFTFTGPTKSHDIYNVFHSAYKDPKCPARVAVLVDNRLSTTRDTRGPAGTKAYAKFFLEYPERPEVTRIAVLLPEPALPEYAGTIDDVAREGGVVIHAFSDEEEARKWLEVKA